MAIKYIPRNSREIQIYRRERAIKEKNRTEITDNTLILMRRINLSYRKNNKSLEERFLLLNEYIKKQKLKKISEIINYFLADIS